LENKTKEEEKERKKNRKTHLLRAIEFGEQLLLFGLELLALLRQLLLGAAQLVSDGIALRRG
jgi:hypothetical protein